MLCPFRVFVPILLAGVLSAQPVSVQEGQERRLNQPQPRDIILEGHGTVRLFEQAGRKQAAWRAAGRNDWQALSDPDPRIMFRTGAITPTKVPPFVPGNLQAPASGRLFLVQFVTQALEAYRFELRRLGGVEIKNYLPFQTYLVRMDAGKLGAVRALPFVQWAAPFHLTWKIEPQVLVEIETGKGAPTRRYNVVLVDPDRDRPALVKEIEGCGGKIDELFEGNLILEATLNQAQLLKVAASSHVLWIDRWTPAEYDMDNARIQGGANYVEIKVPGGLTGKGIRGEIYEGIYTAHPEFAGTGSHRSGPITHYAGGNSHGHRTYAEIFAKGVRAQARGLLPDGQGIFAYNGTSASRNVDRLFRELTDPRGSYRGMFQTASWGGSRTRSYTSTSATLDRALFKYDLVRTTSQSNAGNRDSRPEAWAKNVISGGGVRHRNNSNPNDDYWGRGASIGPAVDGRIKPDLCAYYDGIYCAYSYSSRGNIIHTYTPSFSGTSGATPIICGHAGLAMEMFCRSFFGHQFQSTGWQHHFTNRPHMTTTKALLINTARQYTFSGTSHDLTRVHQGWGFPHVGDMYDLRQKMLVLNEVDVLKNLEKTVYQVWVPAGTAQLRATMIYADVEGTANSTVNLVNDLDLKVVDPNGKTYWGNYGLGGSANPGLAGNYSVSGGSKDSRDPVENVFIDKPIEGIYTVEITAAAVNKDTHVETTAVDADFALVVSGIGAGRDRSGMTLDLTSSKIGELKVDLKNLPTGFSEGWTVFSFATDRDQGMGHFAGMDLDKVSFMSLVQPKQSGNVFHFESNKALVYPNATYHFPAALAIALRGQTIDAASFVVDSKSRILAISNVARVQVK